MKVTLFRDLPTERWWSMERYADELTRALQQIGCDARSYVAARPLLQLHGALNTLTNYAWRSMVYPLAARFHQGDINHIVDHSYAHLIRTLDPRRTVVTCHDLAPLVLNEGCGLGRRLWEQSFRAMLRAPRIIADSAFTRAEILRHADYPAERITVVPLSVGAEFFEPVSDADVRALRERYHLFARRVILHVGSCAPRKNIEIILNALSEPCDLDAAFVQVGGQFSRAQLDLMASLNLQGRVIQAPPTFGAALRAWYRVADVFVFPSWYEGFGMPMIEAMASGTPVICADTSALPEVVGDAAILIDPRDSDALATAIARVCDEPQLMHELRMRGFDRAHAFTWENCARQTLEMYRWIADQPKAR